jgi:hypothetical protein
VLGRTSAAGHEPAAKAATDRITVIDRARETGKLARVRAAGTEHQQAWHTEGIPGHVTPEALEGALELRRARRRVGTLFKCVEHHTGRFVVSGDLEDITASHPAERDAVVEEQRARILFADESSLQACTREDEQLRVHGKLQRLERRAEESTSALEGELKGSVLQLLVHVNDDIVQRRR